MSNTCLERTRTQRLLHFLLQPRTRRRMSWLLVFGALGMAAASAWYAFHRPQREDRNNGHVMIDFGGQWLSARTVIEGHGRYLYHRNYLRRVADEHYSPSDAQTLLEWVSGNDGDDDIGGSLYPPIHALAYAPLALLPPRLSYRVMQGILLALVFFAGWVAQRMTQGRVWWPAASLFLFMFPGVCSGCIELGQNGPITLALLLMGWRQLMCGREALAGLCWGLLAYKPVWAAAFLLVPLVTGRWRMAASMIVTGLALIVVTLPVVSWHAWLDWLRVGRMASGEYTRQENWIILSRDVFGLPRRWLIVYEGQLASRLVWEQSSATDHPESHPLPPALGWGLWAAVLGLTLLVLWRRPGQRQALAGPAAAFVLLGAMFSCYHFLYYDVMVAALPLLLLFAEPRRYVHDVFHRRPYWLRGKGSLSAAPWSTGRWLTAALPALLLVLLLAVPAVSMAFDRSWHFPPSDTFALLALWAWCGYRVLRPVCDDWEEKNIPCPDKGGAYPGTS